jgi:hypothetical protein
MNFITETPGADIILIENIPYLRDDTMREIDRGVFNSYLEKISGLSDEQSGEVLKQFIQDERFNKHCKRVVRKAKRYNNKSRQWRS